MTDESLTAIIAPYFGNSNSKFSDIKWARSRFGKEAFFGQRSQNYFRTQFEGHSLNSTVKRQSGKGGWAAHHIIPRSLFTDQKGKFLSTSMLGSLTDAGLFSVVDPKLNLIWLPLYKRVSQATGLANHGLVEADGVSSNHVSYTLVVDKILNLIREKYFQSADDYLSKDHLMAAAREICGVEAYLEVALSPVVISKKTINRASLVINGDSFVSIPASRRSETLDSLNSLTNFRQFEAIASKYDIYNSTTSHFSEFSGRAVYADRDGYRKTIASVALAADNARYTLEQAQKKRNPTLAVQFRIQKALGLLVTPSQPNCLARAAR